MTLKKPFKKKKAPPKKEAPSEPVETKTQGIPDVDWKKMIGCGG